MSNVSGVHQGGVRTGRRAVLAAVLAAVVTACGDLPRPTPDIALPLSAAAPAVPESPPRPFTLVATGALAPGSRALDQARQDAGGDGYDFRAILAGVKPVVSSADLALCHLRVPFGDPAGPFSGPPSFLAPPQLARSLADTGYDACSTASDHMLDGGEQGAHRTLGAMDDAGLGHAGSARSAEEAERPAILEAGGAGVVHLAYTGSTGGHPVGADRPWTISVIDPGRIVADARAARRAGADVVVVSLHWGAADGRALPEDRRRALAAELARSRSGGLPDIDLILGTHPRVPQAYEKVHGIWVVHGLGSQLADDASAGTAQVSSLARFTFVPPGSPGGRWEVRDAEFVPQLTTAPGDGPLRVINLNEALRQTPDDRPRQQARDRVRDVVLSRGAAGDGLRMTG
ncbi:CapA family protein [Streptomyces sodiiphilus]|uniref:CapA family protein n=1 Tax=Streptomyces sodiiphilus TaxID=226217 RepID=A0ABN2PUY5_9ACTN